MLTVNSTAISSIGSLARNVGTEELRVAKRFLRKQAAKGADGKIAAKTKNRKPSGPLQSVIRCDAACWKKWNVAQSG